MKAGGVPSQGMEPVDQTLCRVRKRLTAAAMRGGRSWDELFDLSDKNRDGMLFFSELHMLIRDELAVPVQTISDYEIKVLFNGLDNNNSNTVDSAELIEYIQHGPLRSQDYSSKCKQKQRMERVRRNLRSAFQSIGGNEMDMRKIFAHMDLDGNTRLSQYEFTMFVRHDLGLTRWDVPNASLNEFFNTVDSNENGTLELNELVHYVRVSNKERKLLGAQSLYLDPDVPKIERRRKTFRQKLGDHLALQKSTSLPSLCSSAFTNVGRARPPLNR